MKISIFFLAFATLQSFAIDNYAQTKKIDLKITQASIVSVLEKIEDETDFFFFYNNHVVNLDKKVSIDLKGKMINEILDEVFRDTDVKYAINNRQIILSAKESDISQQQKSVSGKVTDSSGAPLPGVTVIVEGTTQGTITDSNGNYSLSPIPENATLQFSFVGMKTQKIEVAGKTTIQVKLIEESVGIDEVVAIGYGTQKKINLTGAVSSLNSEKLTTSTVADISNNLSGKLAGLRVVTLGSEPGTYNNSISIRGWGSMLVVIDGIPRSDFQRLDPSSIDNISILKDASAAVYGVRAANGVMLITTKQGKAGRGEIQVNASTGFEYMTDYPRAISNSIDNLILKNEAALVARSPLPYPDYQKYTGEDTNYPSVDWWDLTIRNRMPMNKNDISFQGGSDKITYYVSVGNLHQTGIYNTSSMNYDRYNFRSNISAKIVNGLTANVVISGMIDKRQDPFGSSDMDFMKQVWAQPPYQPIYANNTPPYYYDGEADRNPLAVIDADLTGYRKYDTRKIETTMSLTYDVPFIKGLQLKGLFAYDLQYNIQKLWRKAYNEYKYNATTEVYTATGITTPTQLQQYFDEWVYPESQISLNYKHLFSGKHDFEGLLLLERRNGFGSGFMGQSYFDLSTMDQLNAGLTADQVAKGVDKILNANLGIVGRFNYNYKSKYLAEFSFRNDASSLFPPNSRWGFFPNLSAGWRLSEESFIKDNFSFISNLKLRASYGVMGDDSGAGGFQYISGFTYPSGSYMLNSGTLTSGSVSTGLANGNITWYTAKTSNIGLDGTLWNGLLDFTAEVFRRSRDGLLSTRVNSLPAEFGASFPKENLNSDLSSGFEISIGHTQKINDFLYSVRANLSYAKQKWLHYEQASAANSYDEWRNINEDRLTNITWGYGVDGQFQDQEAINTAPVQDANGHAAYFPGDIKYTDWNEDGMIDSHDMYPIARGVDPQIYYGLETNTSWKGLSLNLLFQGATSYSQTPSEQLQGPLAWGRNSLTIFLDRWHHEDPLDFSTPWVPGKYPITRDGFGFAGNKLASTYWIENVTYLRLKSIELSYTLPASVLKIIHAKEVRVYTNAFNALTFKNKGTMFDPEKRANTPADGYRYPIMSSWNCGLSITF